MVKKFVFPINHEIYENVTTAIQKTLTKNEKDRKNILQIMVSAEDVLGKMVENSDGQDGSVKLVISRILGNIKVRLSCAGEKFELITDKDISWDDSEEEMGENSQNIIREILINRFSENLVYRHRNHVNTVIVKGKQNEYFMIYMTLICLAAGIAFGFLMKYVLGDAFSAGLQSYVLEPARTMFLNALGILVGPVVFFSMVCCISNFGRLTDIGKIGAKVLSMYLLTTVIAVSLGFTLYHLFPVGDPSLLEKSDSMLTSMNADEIEEMNEAAEMADGGISVKDTIVNIISNNIISPFLNNNLLQLLFLSIFMGAGVSALQDEHPQLRSFFVRFNALFMTMLDMLCKLIPVAVFCNMACLVYETGTDVLKSILSYVLLCMFGIFCMIVIYNVLILVLGGLNPLLFMKRYFKVMLTALTLSSSTAAMPVSMEECRKMGISNKIVSFSIPLGSTINMDGSSLVMSIICMFMAQIYRIEITPSLLFTILISIVLLSMGAPSIAGADLAIIVVLLKQIGIPFTAIALIMGVDTLLDMMQAMCNTTSDGAIALIVAKRVGELDMAKYTSD